MEPAKNSKAGIYIRTTTTSLECGLQRKELRKYANECGLRIVGRYEDIGASVFERNRPGDEGEVGTVLA